jgi:hypothetical protein
MTKRLRQYRAEKSTVLATVFGGLSRQVAKAKMGKRLPKALNDEIRSVLNGEIKPSQATGDIAKAASAYRSVLNNTVKDMVKSGHISKGRGNELLTNAARDGYFPRIFDFEFMDTKNGKKLFQQTLSEGEYTKAQLKAIHGLFGVAKKKADPLRGTRRLTNGKYKLSEDLVKEFYKGRRAAVDRATSTHFDFSRKTDLPQGLIDKFSVTDVNYAVQRYVEDAYSVILRSKYFGKGSLSDGPISNSLLETIGKQYGKQSQEHARETYLRMMKNPKSEVTKAWNELQDWESSVINKAKSIQSMKLVLQPLINVPQAITNSYMSLAADMGLARAAWTAWKGVLNTTFTKEGRQFAAESGAASQSIMMQILGEHGGSTSKLATSLLKYAGVPKVEEWVRRWSAGIGRAMVESKEREIQKLIAQRNTRGLSNSQERRLNFLHEDLQELGIAPQDVGRVTQQQMKIASTMFSDVVNFVPDALAIPRNMQGPWASVVRQFKTFIFMQSRLMKNVVVKAHQREGMKGASKALAGIASAPVVTFGFPFHAEELRAQVRQMVATGEKDDSEHYWFGRYDELTPVEKYIIGFATIGGMGFHGEFMADALNTNVESAVTSLAGPTASDLMKVGGGIVRTTKRAVQGDTDVEEPLVRGALGTLPLGSSFGKRAYPESSSGYSKSYEKAYKGMQGGR